MQLKLGYIMDHLKYYTNHELDCTDIKLYSMFFFKSYLHFEYTFQMKANIPSPNRRIQKTRKSKLQGNQLHVHMERDAYYWFQ